jgi:4-amino-4-deoxy-L-arabinose transferase-like glycosyltransferase
MPSVRRAGATYGAVALLLAMFAGQCILSMLQESPTSDEVPHLTAGYTYLKLGDYRLNYEHPPLAKLIAALPLLGLDLKLDTNRPSWSEGREWAFGEGFINHNTVPAQTIIFWGRLPMVALGILLGLLVYLWAREIYGHRAGLAALTLFAFCPNMLANSPLATMDVANCLFTTLALYAFYHLLVTPTWRMAALTGCALGGALGTKMTSFGLFPILVMLGVIFALKRERRRPDLVKLVCRSALVLAAAALVIVLAYRVTEVGQYFASLKYFVRDVAKGGRPAFLFGKYSDRGWFYYFPAAILVKTPIPSLALMGLAIGGLAKRRKLAVAEWLLVLPAALFLGGACLSRLQLGLRYVIQIYPLMFILAGGAISGALAARPLRQNRAALVVAALLVWYCVGTLSIFPNYLAYFNELVGGPKNGYKCLLDSNLDWGQDLPGLARLLEREGNPEVILSFFGTAWPGSYGITYQEFYSYNLANRREAHINSLDPRRELFVISANSLQCLYYPDKTIYDWLKQRKPLATVGYSMFVYDITTDSDAQTKLGIMYCNNHYFTKGERQFRRALAIDPENSQARQYLDALAQRQPPGQ